VRIPHTETPSQSNRPIASTRSSLIRPSHMLGNSIHSSQLGTDQLAHYMASL
jgi:hypothetical protein